MMRSVLLIVSGMVLYLAGQAMPEQTWWDAIRPYTELTALGALIAGFAWILKVEMPRRDREAAKREADLLEVNRAQQAAFVATLDRINDRWDGWERIRHEDHEGTQSVLRDMTANCAAARVAMERREG